MKEPRYTLKCSKCGAEELRDRYTPFASCFPCKKERKRKRSETHPKRSRRLLANKK